MARRATTPRATSEARATVEARVAFVGYDAALDDARAGLRARGWTPVRIEPDAVPTAEVVAVLAADVAPERIERWRAAGLDVPVLCLARSDPELAAAHRRAGADDVLVPPLRPDDITFRLELALRLRAPRRLMLPQRTVDLAARLVHGPDGVTPITDTEARLLDRLARARGRTVDRRTLQRAVWGPASGRDSRALDHAVRRLRVKLEAEPGHPRCLLTVYGLGYRLKADDGPAPTPSARPVDAPLPLVGRAETLAALRARLDADGVVWLWGPAGVGKSRLARALVDERPHVWIAVTPDTGPDTLARRLAAGLDLPLPADDALSAVGVAADRLDETTVVVDGLDDAADALSAVLLRHRSGSRSARWVVTSRRRGGGAVAHRIDPLPIDSARALFLVAVGRHGPLPADAGALAAAALRGLDGLPLTLLLVAGRTRHAGLAAVAGHADDGPPVDGALREVIERAWAGLDDWRRRVLAACALFAGEFELTALLRLRPVLDVAAPPLDALVDDLIARSLVERVVADEPRLWLLPTVRSEVLRLAGAGYRTSVERFAHQRVELAEAFAEQTFGDGAARALAGLGRLLVDLEAIARAPETPRPIAARACLAAGVFYGRQQILGGHEARLAAFADLDGLDGHLQTRVALQRAAFSRIAGRYREGSAVLEAARPPDALAAEVQLERARLALRQGRLDAAAQAVEAGLEAAIARGDRRVEGWLYDRAATLARRRGAWAEAEVLYDRAAEALRAADAAWPELVSGANRALMDLFLGRIDAAEARWRAIIDRAGAAGFVALEVGARVNLAASCIARARHADAAEQLEQALSRADLSMARAVRARVSYHRGRLAVDRGDLPRARVHLAEARALARAAGLERVEVAAALWLGLVDDLSGEAAAAAAVYAGLADRVRRLAPELYPLWWFARGAGDDPDPDPSPVGRALVELAAGRVEAARPTLGEALEVRVAWRLRALPEP